MKKIDLNNIDSEAINSIVKWKINSNTSSLYKFCLILLEDVRDKRFVIDEQTYAVLRKKILDQGNASIRENEEFLKKFDFSFKNLDN